MSSNRILLLMGFPLLVFASQIVWVTYSPVATNVASDLGVSKEDMGFLVMLFPILYIIIAYPAGRFLDTKFKASLIVASIAFGLTGVIRILFPTDYAPILIGQILAAAAQPIVVNGIAPYATVYYEEKKRPMAVSLGSAFMYLGMIIAMAVGASVYSRYGVTGLSYYSGALTIVSSIWSLFMVLKVKPVGQGGGSHLPTLESIKTIVRRREVWLFSGIIGLGLAILDIIMTWIEPVFSLTDISMIAGRTTALMISAGVVGASLIPTLAARKNARRTFLMIASGTGVLAYIVLAFYLSEITAYILLGITGFLLMAGLPVIFEWIEKTTPLEQQGETVGVIMFTGHIIAVAALAVSTPTINSIPLFFGLLSTLALLALILASLLPRR